MHEETLFHVALEKPAGERAAFLDQACGGDADLRHRVEALLDAHANPGSFLGQPVIDPGATVNSQPNAGDGEPAVQEIGSRIGPYKLLQKLGEGGMGTVWVAEQQEPVKRRVALKVIKAGMDSAQVLRRFEAERQALALMDHTNIARVLEAGTTAEGRPYFIMELVKGVPITTYCDELRLPLAERLALFVPVCHAIQHAHQKGIIHRDIKPSNVMVAIQDGKPVPKVIDFGVAKALHQSLTGQSLYTEIGQIIGTLEYMSPEQAELSALDIDTRADVYALGVLLYELLTGTTPIDRKRLHQAYAEIVRIIKEEEPPRPSTRLTDSKESLASMAALRHTEPGRLTKAVRGELDWIVMKCLEKDRTRRYETANGLARDVERYLADETVEACPPSARYRLRKFAGKYRAALATATAFALLLMAGVVASTWQAMRATGAERQALAERDDKEQARREAVAAAEAERQATAAEAEQRRKADSERSRAVRAEQDAKDQAAVATAVNAFLRQDLLEQASGEAQANRGFTAKPNLTMKEALDRAAARIGDRFKGQPLVEAAIRETIGCAYWEVGEPGRGVPHLERARTLRAETLGPDHLETLGAMSNLACAYKYAGQTDKALAACKELLAKRAASLGPDHPDTLNSMNSLAMAYQDAGETDQAIPLFEQALSRGKKVLGPESLQVLTTTNNLALTYHEAGRFDEALPLILHVLVKQTEKLGPDHPDTLNSMNNLAKEYKDAGRLDKAIPLFRQALAKQTETLGPDHTQTLATTINLGSAYEAAGNYDQALPLFEQAVSNCKAKLGPDHPITLSATNNLAGVYWRTGQLDKAIPLVEQGLAQARAKLGSDHPDTLISFNNLAMLYKSAGRLDQALPLLEESLSLRRKKLGPDHPLTLTSMNNLGTAYQEAGRLDLALPLLEESLAKSRKTLGPDHPDTLTSMNNLARAYQESKRLDRALPLFEHAFAKLKERCGPGHPSTVTCMTNLVKAYFAASQPDKAVSVLRAALDDQRQRLGPDNPALAGLQAAIAGELLSASRPVEAEPILRDCLAIREKQEPDAWTTFNTKSMLGGSLLGQKKYADCEPLLIQGYEGMKDRQKKIPPAGESRLTDALQRLVQLYEATGQEEKASTWRKQLEATKAAEKKLKP